MISVFYLRALLESSPLTITYGNHTFVNSYDAGDTGDAGSVSGLVRYPGERNDNPCQYSCLENPMKQRSLGATVQKDNRK